MPNHSKKSAKFRIFLGTEIWALCFILVCQEIPFFTIRLFKLIIFSNSASRDYSIYFYVAKNFILCIFEIYRIIIIFYYHRKHSGESSSIKHRETIGSIQVSNKMNQPSSSPIENKSIIKKLSNKIFIRMQPTESMEFINFT